MEYSALWDEEVMNTLLSYGGKRYWDDLRTTHLKGADVLDLAVGSGRHPVELAERFRTNSITAIDIETSRLDRFHPSVEYITADGEQLPFSDKSFDAVTIRAAFHHFPRWRTVGLDEISRVLSNSGVFLFYEPGYWNPPAWFRRRFLRSSSHTPDEQAFKPDKLETGLESQFSDVEMKGFHIVSNMLPVVAKYLPVKIPDGLLRSSVRIEQAMPLRKFSWLLI